MSDTLLLNQDGAPLSMLPPSVIDWTMAIKLLYLNKVMVVKNYDDWTVRSQKLELPVPSIVMTRRYVRPKNKVLFNRKMVYLRDNYTCQTASAARSSASVARTSETVPHSVGTISEIRRLASTEPAGGRSFVCA